MARVCPIRGVIRKRLFSVKAIGAGKNGSIFWDVRPKFLPQTLRWESLSDFCSIQADKR